MDICFPSSILKGSRRYTAIDVYLFMILLLLFISTLNTITMKDENPLYLLLFILKCEYLFLGNIS